MMGGATITLSLAIKDTTCSVHVALNREDCLSYAKKKKPDLVFINKERIDSDAVATLDILHSISPKAIMYLAVPFCNESLRKLAKLNKSNIPFEICHRSINCEQSKFLVDSILK